MATGDRNSRSGVCRSDRDDNEIGGVTLVEDKPVNGDDLRPTNEKRRSANSNNNQLIYLNQSSFISLKAAGVCWRRFPTGGLTYLYGASEGPGGDNKQQQQPIIPIRLPFMDLQCCSPTVRSYRFRYLGVKIFLGVKILVTTKRPTLCSHILAFE